MKYEVNEKKYSTLIKNIHTHFSQAEETLWDKRNKINILHHEGEILTVKSFKIPHFINKIAYTFFRNSKAYRSYHNSLRILDFVPKPIGYVEFFRFGFLHDSYFICQKYEYDFTIREPLLDKDFPNKALLLKQFAKFTHTLHINGIAHLDYSPGNILVKEISENQYEFKIVDVNRMKFKIYTKKESLESFSKLWAVDEDLKSIIEAYAKLIDMNKEEALSIVLQASQKHKNKKNFKKRLKGRKVVD